MTGGGQIQYIYIKRIKEDGSLKCNDNHWMNAMKEKEENRVLYDLYGNVLFQVEDAGVDTINEFLTANQEFIEYLIHFRDNIYAPIRNAKLEEEKNIADEQKARDKKLSDSIPKIGMTGEEVRKSKWGNPDKVNKDTYSWGTEEQWVYENKGYVYFKNGIVTSVSER